ncbi:hypothetical protein CDD83_10310 [Cordyceps sp. RAO-2017]|nr:hypothetical protein CDD83_10310 [Cordyceps sp. RAO-2017]
MRRAWTTAQWLTRALRVNESVYSTGIPMYLCPAIGLHHRNVSPKPLSVPTLTHRRANHAEASPSSHDPAPLHSEGPIPSNRKLPVTCSGCGAFVQTSEPQQLGYFDPESKRVRNWLNPSKKERKGSRTSHDAIVDNALQALGASKMEELGLSPSFMLPEPVAEAAEMKAPICDRCHNLTHYSTTSETAKLAMYHPTVESLRETIEESPHKYNHIYHIIDAADFPMSLIPRLNVLLGDIPLRTRNRRSQLRKFRNNRHIEMSFIITRSDLLAPTKDMVDAMMPYLQKVLREALGRLGGRVRLGNVRCVSAKRGWWTKAIKEDIWHRGGAGWMVGKVNVGKSQLFEAVYPKGRVSTADDETSVATYPRDAVCAESLGNRGLVDDEVWDDAEMGELLPPPQPAEKYPQMPLVSPLPGTTASPIRVPFGSGKGELIDLPGLARSDLELFVKQENRKLLIMKSRIIPEQVSVTPGKSLILGGGLIRITPRTDGLIFLMYNFTPIKEHMTSTQKAIEFQQQTRLSVGLENLSLPGIGEKMRLAGTFALRHDVTKKRAGPLTRKNAVALHVDKLPFRVVSVDILIEGVGYVEVVAQVRAREFNLWAAQQREADEQKPRAIELIRDRDRPVKSNDPFSELMSRRKDGPDDASRRAPLITQPDWPAVDVYTPEGRFVACRQPIHGWLNNKPLVLACHKKSRPRRSMRGQKKKEKSSRRAEAEAKVSD